MLLQIKSLETFYGASQALFGVDLNIEQGQVVALMGRNGMGKTTTINTLCGICRASGGDILFDGQSITQLASHKVARLGVGLVPEGRRCFGNLSVQENLLVAARQGHTDGLWDLAAVEELFPRLGERYAQSASSLSGGEQQMLAIGRALMTNPKLLILDEATEGLAPVIRQEIWRAIKALKARGQSILIVDKTLSELLPIADRCIVLERGKTVFNDVTGALDDEIAQRYLGV
ncbi:MAG: ABC transporter ATP-binding protein [Pseudomonadales bacterium]